MTFHYYAPNFGPNGYDATEPSYAELGDTVQVRLPYSEVCMHMHVAGDVMPVTIEPTMARITFPEGHGFSLVTHGEAGIYRTESTR